MTVLNITPREEQGPVSYSYNAYELSRSLYSKTNPWKTFQQLLSVSLVQEETAVTPFV